MLVTLSVVELTVLLCQSDEEEQGMGLLGLGCHGDYTVGVRHFYVGFLKEQGPKTIW